MSSRAEIESWPTGRLLSVAARLVESRWHAYLDELGLSHAGLIALHVLGSEPASQRLLARRCQVTDQTMSRTIERLEAAGFVRRTSDQADRRRTLVEITPAGHDVREQAIEAERRDPAILQALGADEQFRGQLVKLIEASQQSLDQKP